MDQYYGGHNAPHPMFYQADGAAWGANLTNSPVIERRQFFLVDDSFERGDNFLFGMTGQNEFGAFVGFRKDGVDGWCVEAAGGANFWAPKFWVIEHGHPPPADHAEPAVFAFCHGFIAVARQHQNGGVVRDGVGSGAPGQGDFRVAVHQILFDRGHLLIGRRGILGHRAVGVPGTPSSARPVTAIAATFFFSMFFLLRMDLLGAGVHPRAAFCRCRGSPAFIGSFWSAGQSLVA